MSGWQLMILGAFLAHVLEAVIVVGVLWYWSRDPKPSGVLPFRRHV